MPHKINPNEVTYSLEILPEEISVRGNAMASGDDSIDKETEDWILAELARGNECAWFCAKVTAEWHGFEGTDYLGTCSYRSEKEFREDSYFTDMKSNAFDQLQEEVNAVAERLGC